METCERCGNAKPKGTDLCHTCDGPKPEPEPGDYIMSDAGRLGSRTSVSVVEGKHVGTFDTEEDAVKAIRDRMVRERFWPDVWYQDDHGGIIRRNLGRWAEGGVYP